MKLSALIIARNEEKKIEQCLKCLTFVDEIIVILDRSIDNTKVICRKYTKKIFEGSWELEGERRNFGISKCNSEWIIEIDSDEIISKKLSLEIILKTNQKNTDFFYIKLLNYVDKKPIKNGWMSCIAPDGKFLLFKKNKKVWENQRVHPNYKLYGRKGTKLINPLIHNMSDNISDLILRFNRNTDLRAKDLIAENQNLKKFFSIRKIFSRFLKSYISRRGFSEGELGILICILNSIYPIVAAIKAEFINNISNS